MTRVTDLLKSAVELNLRYTSTLLYLSKDYLKEVNGVIAGTPSQAPPTDQPSPRAPLLIAGRAGEVAQGAFMLTNSNAREMNVHLVVQGELSDKQVKVEPSRFTLKPEQSATVRVLVSIDDTMPLDEDRLGSVVAPGNQAIAFVVRRLPDDPAGGDSKPPAGDDKPTAARRR